MMKTTITKIDNLLEMPHIGATLKSYFRKKRTRKAVLARLMNIKKSSISNYQKRDTLQMAILWKLCIHLKHNFFADIAKQLPDHYTTETPVDTSKEEQITQLQQEVNNLKIQIKTLEKIVIGIQK